MSRDNSGSMSKNKRKEKDNHPDLKGKATIAGVEYWISGWKKDGDDGPWLSLAFEPKDKDKPARPVQAHGKHIDHDADIPF